MAVLGTIHIGADGVGRYEWAMAVATVRQLGYTSKSRRVIKKVFNREIIKALVKLSEVKNA